MQTRHRKVILWTLLAGVVALVVLDPVQDPTKSSGRRDSAQGETQRSGNASADAAKAVATPDTLALPERALLETRAGHLFGSQSWQPPPSKVVTAPPKPIAPPMPYRFAGKLMQHGHIQIFLSKGDMPIAIRQGEILEGNYRVESITDDRVTLVYVPLGQSTVIPVISAISAATPPASPFGALAPPGGTQRDIGSTPSAPAVASSPRFPFQPPQRDNPAAAATEMKLPPLLWEGSRQGK